MDIKYYDERYYLGKNSTLEREYILNAQSEWNFLSDFEETNYAFLIANYDLYIELARKLIGEVAPSDDSLSQIHTIMYLINNGTFSYSDKFECKSLSADVLHSKLGINILYGKGCCRHVSGFISDVMPESRVLTCVRNVDNPYESKGNHMINLIEYDAKKYGFDGTNGGILYNFISEFEMDPTNKDGNVYLNYKPYGEIVFFRRSFEEIKDFLEQIKKSGNSTISVQKLSDIALSSQLSIASNMDIIEDFLNDSRSQVKTIKEKIKEIKISG